MLWFVRTRLTRYMLAAQSAHSHTHADILFLLEWRDGGEDAVSAHEAFQNRYYYYGNEFWMNIVSHEMRDGKTTATTE